jgi:hypothetical protein
MKTANCRAEPAALGTGAGMETALGNTEASTVADALHAAGRAAGFALGTETEGA